MTVADQAEHVNGVGLETEPTPCDFIDSIERRADSAVETGASSSSSFTFSVCPSWLLKSREVDAGDESYRPAAFTLKLEKLASNLLTADDVSLVVDWLREESSLTDENGEDYMDFEGMWRVRERCRDMWGGELDRCFLATTFLKLQAFGGAVPVEVAGDYIQRFVQMKKLNIELCYHDKFASGHLTGKALEDFLEEIQVFEGQDTDTMMLFRARQVAAAKFVFHHGRNGVMKTVDLLVSPVMEELQRVRIALERDGFDDPDGNNWFSRKSIETIIDAFRELDSRGHRRLVVGDLLAFQGAKFTPLFLHRLFEERIVKTTPRSTNTAGREMDLEKFAEFVIAWRDKGAPAAVRYFFPIFDIEKKGYLTHVDIHMFFREVFDVWVECQQEGSEDPNMCENVVNEIFEMVNPKVFGKMYRQDLESSGKAANVFGMLADMWEFWRHENGEVELS